MWWKILSIIILLYVVIAGFVTPIKPGLVEVSKLHIDAGEDVKLTIKGYNTKFSAGDNRVWLRLDEGRSLRASQVTAKNDNELQASFQVPNNTPSTKANVPLTLVVDNPAQGVAIMPSAVFLKAKAKNYVNTKDWDGTIDNIHETKGIQFPYRNILVETIRNTFFHIPLWFSMFILLLCSMWYSVKYLRFQNIKDDIYASSFIGVGVLFGILGLCTGSVWARFTWGTFWTDDIKLNMSAVAMLIYVAYLVLRGSINDVDRRAKISAGYAIFAFVALIPLVFVIPRLTDSLHPGNGGNPALGGEDMENTLRMVFYPAVIGFTLLGLWIVSQKIRLAMLKERLLMKDLKE